MSHSFNYLYIVMLIICSCITGTESNQYKSFRDFLSRKTESARQMPISAAILTSPPPVLQTARTGTASSIATAAFVGSQPASTNGTKRILIEIMEVVGGSVGSYILFIIFKFIRNGYRCKAHWFYPKWRRHHDDDDEDEDDESPPANPNQQTIVDLLELVPIFRHETADQTAQQQMS